MTGSEELQHLFYELFEAAGAGRRSGDMTAAQVGQTQSRWQTLWTLAAAPLTAPQVARRLGVSRQHTLRLANELLAEGLVEFTRNPDHKTSPLIVLTAEGHEVLAAINAAALEFHTELLREFTADNVTQLRTLLQEFSRIVKSFNREE